MNLARSTRAPRIRFLSTSALGLIAGLALLPTTTAAAQAGAEAQSKAQTTEEGDVSDPLLSSQDAVQDSGGDAPIVVTGSRIATDGTKAPTPVTVVSAEQLSVAAPRTITEGLLQLPSFAGSSSVQNQSTGTTSSNGAAHLNLRGLGTSRTLVLLSGRRIVPATNVGSVDISLIPEALIQRVEIVTGGASAAYGSDAVGGVVNFILDNRFKGIKGSIQSSVSQRGDNEGYKLSLAAGHALFDDRLHLTGSFEHYDSAGIETANKRKFTQFGRGIINNPGVTAATPASPTNPVRLVVVNPLGSTSSLGGLITNTALAGTTFNPDGSARPFQYGTLRTGATMQGSPDPNAYNSNLLLTLQPAQERTAGFAHIRYDVFDGLEVYAEGLLSQSKVYYNSLPTFELSNTAFTIFRDNAYLPASVRQQMISGNIQSFAMGRVSPDIAIPTLNGKTDTVRYVFGADGKFGGDWTYNAYYQFGRSHALFETLNDPISNNLYRAADAVVNPANGQIVCRSTLTNAGDGCVPINLFGFGAPSQAAIDYVNGTAVQDSIVKQHVAEFSVQGSVFELPGGSLGLAAGVGWRKERFDQVVDPISSSIRTGIGIRGFPVGLINTLGGFERTNPQPSSGEYNVKEVFAEVNVPLLADMPFARQLTLNGAVRYTDYSLSGGVTTWKAGAVWEPFTGLRFRATRSRDIRAPSLGELFRGSSQGTSTIIDPFRNNETRNALTGNIGNVGLTPEIADTLVLGGVFQPEFIPGLSLSVDYYKVEIRDALSALSAQRTVDLCFAGAAELCAFIQRDPSGIISRVELPFFNVDFRSAKGIDFEASYRTNIGDTSLSFRLLGTRLISFTTQVAGAAAIEDAGDIGNNTPKWTGILSANLDFGRASFYVQERYVGSGKFDNQFGPADININFQKAVWYTDATINFDLDEAEKIQWFLTVNNLFDRDPPQTPSFLIQGSSFGNRTLYDQVGRMFTSGVRFKF
ncbi:MAG: TonB-dependent receptor [Hyphomonadaceae bacterium]|nr:TonB-dependent receptor [Hyphomonadaceae bacterium]